MCDVRKLAARLAPMGLVVGLLAGAMTPVQAQMMQKKRKQETHAHRETNATRLARIKRATEETYSHRYEVIGGGGYLRFRSGEYTKKNNEVSWATALNYYLNSKLAVVADARGSFGDGNAMADNVLHFYKPQINEYTFMGGASYRFYATEKWAASVQALAGTGWGLFSGGAKGYTGSELGLWNDGFRPAYSLGVSVDYNIYPSVALRFTPTYVGTDFAFTPMDISTGTVDTKTSEFQNNIGFNVGVVYRFGHR